VDEQRSRGVPHTEVSRVREDSPAAVKRAAAAAAAHLVRSNDCDEPVPLQERFARRTAEEEARTPVTRGKACKPIARVCVWCAGEMFWPPGCLTATVTNHARAQQLTAQEATLSDAA
jgi:hypothetical protein